MFAVSHSGLQTAQRVDGVLVVSIIYLVLVGGGNGSWISLQSALRALTQARLPFLGASAVGGCGGEG